MVGSDRNRREVLDRLKVMRREIETTRAFLDVGMDKLNSIDAKIDQLESWLESLKGETAREHELYIRQQQEREQE